MATKIDDIHQDPVITRLLEKMPKKVASSFNEEQLSHLRNAIGAREWGKHKLDVRGTVKFFNQERGFGFITPDEGGDDVFVHISSVERSGLPGVEDGMKLIFDLAADARGKGPKAVNLKPIDGAADAGEEPSSGEEE